VSIKVRWSEEVIFGGEPPKEPEREDVFAVRLAIRPRAEPAKLGPPKEAEPSNCVEIAIRNDTIAATRWEHHHLEASLKLAHPAVVAISAHTSRDVISAVMSAN